MKLYLIRHGESVNNASKLHQGSTPPLSKRGEKQAEFVAERFRNIPVDVIFSSDYVRARQTAEKIAGVVQKQIQFTELLREVKRPTEIEGKHIYDPHVMRVKQQIQSNWHKAEWHYGDEENFVDFRTRAEAFIAMIEQRTERTIVAVSHGLFMRMLVSWVCLRESLTDDIFHRIMKSFKTSNTGITVCEYGEGGWKLDTWNDYAHLGDV
ncbi:MAG: hypothetical protein RI947_1026 [Candidatus Parcubacteria bacterium]|jgi:uncharacterized phosphatase